MRHQPHRSTVLRLESLEDRVVPSTVPNDPFFNRSYHHDLVQSREAWDLTTGDSRVIVSIHDHGVDYTHPDLYKNLWLNQEEIPRDVRDKLTDIDADGLITFWDLNESVNQGPGKITDLNGTGFIDGGDLLRPQSQGGWADGRDTGHNGYTDDLIGWDFGDNDNDPRTSPVSSHGTIMAGVIGAIGNNGTGLAGVAWKVQMMPVKMWDDAGAYHLGSGPGSLVYAADNGARVSNHSYSARLIGPGAFPPSEVTASEAALAYAASRGHLAVGAAGNDREDNDQVPKFPVDLAGANSLSVAATTRNDRLASFSNYGATSVDLGAPGVNIWTTLPQGDYGHFDGTSMSSPLVAGAAALLLARSPNLTVDQLKAALLSSVDPVTDLAGKTVTGGRLNVYRALQSVSAGSWISSTASAATPGNPGRPGPALQGGLLSTTFQQGPTYTDGGAGVETGDVNGDGRLDLVQTGPGTVMVRLGNGDGTFQAPRTSAAGIDGSLTFTVSDLNGDGKADVAAGGGNYTVGGKVSMLLSDGTGGLHSPVLMALPKGHLPHTIAIADFNQDGRPDLAVQASERLKGNVIGPNRFVLDTFLARTDGSFRFKGSSLINSMAGESDMAVADFNQDGKLDVLSARGPGVEFGGPGTFLQIGNGDGTFQPSVTVTNQGGTEVAVGDFNADGHTDFAVLSSSSPRLDVRLINLFLGNGNGAFVAGASLPITTSQYDRLSTLRAVDVNGDRRLDLVTTSSDSGELHVLLGNGDGTFQQARSSAANQLALDLVFADFDGDGDLDLATASHTGGLTLLRNDGIW